MCVEFPFNEFHKGLILATILVCFLTKLFLSSEGRELELQFQAIKQASKHRVSSIHFCTASVFSGIALTDV